VNWAGIEESIRWWAEPASWIASFLTLVTAVAAIVIGWPQLYIKNQLLVPQIETGLGLELEETKQYEPVQELAISPTWSNESLSNPVKLRIITTNVGRGARCCARLPVP
jgi:hypothetical protein